MIPRKAIYWTFSNRVKCRRKNRNSRMRRFPLIETWIKNGAPTARPEPETLGPEHLFTEEERSWWSFQPIRKPEVPTLVFSNEYLVNSNEYLVNSNEYLEVSKETKLDTKKLITKN